MKISFYEALRINDEQRVELREFDVDGELLSEIKEIVVAHAEISSGLSDVSVLITIDGVDYVFQNDGAAYLKKIQSMLTDADAHQHGLLEDTYYHSDDSHDLSNKTLLVQAEDIQDPITAVAAIVEQLVVPCQLVLSPIESILHDAYKNVETLKAFPGLLALCASEAQKFQVQLENLSVPADEVIVDDEELAQTLQVRLDKLNELLRKVAQLHLVINAIKVKHYQILNGHKAFKDRLGDVDIAVLNENHRVIFEALQKISAVLNGAIEQTDKQLKQIDNKKNQNTIVIRTWLTSANDDDQREVMGIPSDGHTTVELCNSEGEKIYLGFYVLPNRDKSTIAKAFKKFGLPSPDQGVGYFVDLAYDESLVGSGKKFSRCETVVVKCDRPGANLDFATAYQWAQETLAKYPEKITKHGRTIRILTDYNFYNNNCSSFAAAVLRKAGASSYLPYSGKSIINIDTPIAVRDYAKSLEAALKKAELTHRESEVTANLAMSQKDKYVSYLKLAIKRLKLLNSEANNPDIKCLIDALSKYITKLNNTQPDNLSNLINELFNTLYRTVSDLIEKPDDAEDNLSPHLAAIIDILKRLTSVMPAQVSILLNALNTTIDAGLYQFNTMMVNSEFGKFADHFVNGKAIILAITKENGGTLENKALSIRAALIKLGNQHKLARKAFHKLAAKKPNNLDELTASYKKLESFYRESYRLLRDNLGVLRNETYFKPAMPGDKNEMLDSLQALFEVPHGDDNKTTIAAIVGHAQSAKYWGNPDAALNKISADQQNQIFAKASRRNSDDNAPKKPNVLAFWNWGKRHQYFEIENKAILHQVVKHRSVHWQDKLQMIADLNEDHKPSVLKFWRRAERRRYDEMSARAAIACLIHAFSTGQMSEMRLSIELENIIPKLPAAKRQQLTKFNNHLVAQYQASVVTDASENQKSSHTRVLKKLLKSAAYTRETVGDSFDDLSVKLFSEHHYLRLKQPRAAANDMQVNIASQSAENIDVEKKLLRAII